MKTLPHRFISSLTFCAALLVIPAAWPGDTDGLAEGQAAFNAGNYELAFARWSELATSGHSDAQVFIGLSYANGWEVKKDPKLASVWYQKAAKSENPSGQFLLGLYYITGSDKQATATGLMWLRRAAANGDDSARRFLEKARARGWFKEVEPARETKQPSVAAAATEEQRIAAVTPSETGDDSHSSPSRINGL